MSWTRIVEVSSTVFFESIAYTTIFPALEYEWQHLDFVGISTYKSLKFLPIEKLKAYLELANCKPYDVVPLYSSGEYLLRQAVAGHTSEFQNVWDGTLQALGYSLQNVRDGDFYEAFFRNTFLITPKWFKALGSFMNDSMHKVAHDSGSFANSLRKDAHYKEGKKDVALRIFHSDHYQWHPFIFERLPVFYLVHHGASVFGSLREVSLFENSDSPSEVLYKGL